MSPRGQNHPQGLWDVSDFFLLHADIREECKRDWSWGTEINWSLSWRLAFDVEVIIEDKAVIREAVSPSSFWSGFRYVSYLDTGHVPQQAEPWFRMKSVLRSADELMFS